MTFSTPFTCTEIIAHLKTLKYFALASKISVGAEDKRQKTKSPRSLSETMNCLRPI